jgi:hypothetical protein
MPRGLRVSQRAGTVGARKLSKCLGLGSSLRYRVGHQQQEARQGGPPYIYALLCAFQKPLEISGQYTIKVYGFWRSAGRSS